MNRITYIACQMFMPIVFKVLTTGLSTTLEPQFACKPKSLIHALRTAKLGTKVAKSTTVLA